MAISRKGLRRIMVDGAEYFWSAVDDIEYRVAIVTGDGVERGQRGRWIRFEIPYQPDLREPGWWEDHRVTVTPRMIQRAIVIARRHDPATDVELSTDEMRDTIGLELLRIEDELHALTRVLETGTRADLVPRVLAVGCRDGSPPLLDDWTACHSDVLRERRFELQSTLDVCATFLSRQAFATRSAIEFVVAMCKRVGIDLELDPTIADDNVRKRQPESELPWGIPESHWWWTGSQV